MKAIFIVRFVDNEGSAAVQIAALMQGFLQESSKEGH